MQESQPVPTPAPISHPEMDNNLMGKIRLLVVDDHEVVRRGLVLVLSLEPEIELVGEAANGTAAVELAKQLHPDLILMDYKMPGMSGVEAGQAIKTLLPRCRILILTGLDSDTNIFEALQNGVDGYVLKEITPEKLVQAVKVVAGGGAYLDPDVTRKVLNRLNTNTGNIKVPPVQGFDERANSGPELTSYQPDSSSQFQGPYQVGTQGPDPSESLTNRESEIVKNLALGHSNREIGEILIIGEETIRTHLKSIYRKLGVNDRTQAVVTALKLGLINLD